MQDILHCQHLLGVEVVLETSLVQAATEVHTGELGEILCICDMDCVARPNKHQVYG